MNHQQNRERWTVSVFQTERKEHRVVAQCRQSGWCDWTGLLYQPGFHQAKDEIWEVQGACIFSCVYVCVCGFVLCAYISNNDSYRCWGGWYQALHLLRGVIILEWSGLRARLSHTHKLSFWHPSNEYLPCPYKIRLYIIDCVISVIYTVYKGCTQQQGHIGL